MASQTPFILADNVFDRINLYPSAVFSGTAGAPGREWNYLADYRRERSFWQIAAAQANWQVITDLGAGVTLAGVSGCWFDRGHNLWGHTIGLGSSNDAFASNADTTNRAAVPAQGTVGGDPSTGWAVTEEGAIYTVWPPWVTPARYFRFWSGDNFQPLVTGVIMGARTQLASYSSVLDEDAGERNAREEPSLVPGYYGRDRSYPRRTIEVRLSIIGGAEYDGQIRTLRRLLFEKDQPAFVVMNYGLKPERGWLYQYSARDWSFGAERVYRRGALRLGELGPLIR
jgi:hypothetical protein